MSRKIMRSVLLLQVFAATSAVAAPFSSLPLANEELASIRGTGLPLVGLDQQDAAARASELRVASLGPRASDLAREVADNWSFNVTLPLISAATMRP